MARLGVDARDHVRREVNDLLEVLRRQVQQVAQPARDALEVPDVGHRGGELDVAHPLTADLGAGHLDAAALTDDALEPDPLVLAAVALPVPLRTEDLLAEESVLLGLQGAVVDRLRLLDLTVRPLPDVVGGGQPDAELVEEVDVEHVIYPSCRVFKASWAPGQVRGGRTRPSPGTSDFFDAARSRRDRSIPSSSAARKTSSSVSRISRATPSLESTSTFRHSDCSSLRSTLKDSGIPGSGMFSPLTMASYTFTRPRTSSDLIVSSSWRA